MILSCLLNVGELIWEQTHTLDLIKVNLDLAASEDSLKTLTGDL